MNKVFKFVIGEVIREPHSSATYRPLNISMTAPTAYFRLRMHTGDYERDIEHAKSELKMKMIQALLEGEWEVEK